MHRSRTRFQLPPGQQYRSSRISELAALAKFHLPDWWDLELHRKTPQESSRGWLEGVFERLVFGMRRGHWKTAIKKIPVELLDRLGPTLE